MKVYTLGYEKRNIQEFIDILKTAKVHTLVDVRETAWSYKRDFCKTKLKAALEDAGIEYLHLRELGNPKKFRSSELTTTSVLRKYKTYLRKTESGVHSLMELLAVSKRNKKNICLTCYEKDHNTCHRSVITDYIRDRLIGRIIHL